MKLSYDLVHKRARASLRSFRFRSLQDNGRRPYPVYRPMVSTDDIARVGVISDIHHNTLMLSEVLKLFGKIGVNVIFLLGDYSYVPGGADPDDWRFRQFRTVMELVREYQVKHQAQIVCLMGNHEIEDWYFSERSSSRRLMKQMLPVLKEWGFQVAQDPFLGYELPDAYVARVEANVGGREEDRDTVRQFLLTHAISSPFVSAMYQGFPDDPVRARGMRQEIEASLGHLWAEHVDDRATLAKPLWNEFIGGRTRGGVDQIRQNITNALSFDHIADRHRHNEWVKWFNALDEDTLFTYTYGCASYGDPLWFGFQCELPRTENQEASALSLGKTLESIGAGSDYTISGHFHADLGVYNVCERLGAMGIAGAGFQINKTITTELCCYVIEVDSDCDRIYRISALAHQEGQTDANVDLSGSLSRG